MRDWLNQHFPPLWLVAIIVIIFFGWCSVSVEGKGGSGSTNSSVADTQVVIFRVKCPKCGAEIVGAPTDLKTNGAPTFSVPGQTSFFVRRATMRCPVCQIDFPVRNTKWIPDVEAEEIEIPSRLRIQEMGQPPIPAMPILMMPRATYQVIRVPMGRDIVPKAMSTISIQELVELYNTNRDAITLMIVTPRHEPLVSEPGKN